MTTKTRITLPGSTIGDEAMGTFNVDFTIGSADGDRSIPLVGMVDTGSLYSIVPAPILDELDIARDERELFSLANGSTVEMDIGLALIGMEDRTRTVHVAFGHDPDIVLIGAMTLERFALAADPRNKQLVPAQVTL